MKGSDILIKITLSNGAVLNQQNFPSNGDKLQSHNTINEKSLILAAYLNNSIDKLEQWKK